jgi:hypothetical protein
MEEPLNFRGVLWRRKVKRLRKKAGDTGFPPSNTQAGGQIVQNLRKIGKDSAVRAQGRAAAIIWLGSSLDFDQNLSEKF